MDLRERAGEVAGRKGGILRGSLSGNRRNTCLKVSDLALAYSRKIEKKGTEMQKSVLAAFKFLVK